MNDKLYWVERGATLGTGDLLSMWAVTTSYENALDLAVDASEDPTVEWVRIYVRPATRVLPPTDGTPIWKWQRVQDQPYQAAHAAN